MNNFDISVAEESFGISSRGIITGNIYFYVGGMYFPDNNWNDFVVDILCWWIQAFNDLDLCKKSSNIEFYFKDGPYIVRILTEENGLMKLEFIQRNITENETILKSDINVENLRDSLLSVCRKVIEIINSKGWDTGLDPLLWTISPNNYEYLSILNLFS